MIVEDRMLDYAGRTAARLTRADWPTVVEDTAAKHLSRHIAADVLGRSSADSCRELAQLAREILAVQNLPFRALGHVVETWGGGPFAVAFAEELFSHLEVPGGQDLLAIARGLQVAGVVICLCASRPLSRCACFQDLCAAEIEAVVDQVIDLAAVDWNRLAEPGCGSRLAS